MTRGRAGQVLVTAAAVAGLVSAAPTTAGLLCSAAARPRAALVTNTQPTWSPNGKWLAYTSDRGGAFDVWKTDGTRLRRVVRNATDPAWSPDGRKIAFVATGDAITPAIFVIDASGTGAPRRLLLYGYQPSWSPDGRRIAFASSSGCGQGSSIWVMNADGSGKFIVAESPDEFTDYAGPAWSPDGKRIAYTVYSDQGDSGIHTVPATGEEATPQLVVSDGSQASWSPDGEKIVYVSATRAGYGSLYVIDLHTLGERQLSRQRAATPAWSPGGKRIAFSVRATDGSYDLYAVNPDGSHFVRLTRPSRSIGPPDTGSDFSDVSNSGPAWSPDGRRIAFSTSKRSVIERQGSVAVIGVDGRGRRTVTVGGSPAWSPDGQRIAFVESSPSAGTYLDVVNADGSNRQRLMPTRERDLEPDWSPDGTRIAYQDYEGNARAIFTLNLDTGVRFLVTSAASFPDWSADGSRIMFASSDSATSRPTLEVVNSDGTNRRRLLTGSTLWERPRWSPDDRRIAYGGGQGYIGVYVMNADGGDVRRLADGRWPSWSPDGSSIAFGRSYTGSNYEVMIVPASGSTPRRVTYGGCTIVGTDGGDVLAGTPNDDVICAFGGKDTITGGAGDDRILGGNEGDRIFGGPGRDRIFGEDGADAVDGGPGSDSIRTGKGADVIVADDGEADYVDGEEGTDCAIADARDQLASIERRGCPRVR